jgi:3-mercaptopyruvate sulfurtransferase SseA
MHVHELNPKKTLIVLVAFVILLSIGFLTMKKPVLKYQLDMKQSLKMLHDSNAYFHPAQLTGILDKTEKDVVLIDLRNNLEYSRGAIPGAENISAMALLDEDNIRRLKKYKEDGINVVIYGNDQLSANGPWMVFQQLGFDNVSVLLGGYNYYSKWKNNLSESGSDKSYLKGIAKYNFKEVAKSSAPVNEDDQNKAKPVIIQRRKKTSVVSGGC